MAKSEITEMELEAYTQVFDNLRQPTCLPGYLRRFFRTRYFNVGSEGYGLLLVGGFAFVSSEYAPDMLIKAKARDIIGKLDHRPGYLVLRDEATVAVDLRYSNQPIEVRQNPGLDVLNRLVTVAKATQQHRQAQLFPRS